MDDREVRWANALTSIDFVKFSMAEDLGDEKATGTWKQYTFSQNYSHEGKRGKHPTTFRGFLEGHAEDHRRKGHEEVSAGGLEDLMRLHAWCEEAGLTTQQMAFLGVGLVKRLKALCEAKPDLKPVEELANALVQKQTTGEFYLPSYEVPGASPKFGYETEEMDSGMSRIVAVNVWVEGKRYRNIMPTKMVHYLCKRTRAQNILRDAQ